MINTVNTKPKPGAVFTIGSAQPRDTILIVGSCRSNAYLNYLDRYISMTGDALRVRFIDPNDWHWDAAGNPVDFEATITALEADSHILQVLRETTIYIHEHYQSFGMFNSHRENPKNIYQFGLSPRMDICIPNFHDKFILWNDLVTFDAVLRERVANDGGSPSPETLAFAKDMGMQAVEKFCSICALTSIPEMAQHFLDNWKTTRFFWTGNHVSKNFTLYVFRMMNEKFLGLPLSDEFWRGAETEDLFANPHTEVSPHDRTNHGITW